MAPASATVAAAVAKVGAHAAAAALVVAAAQPWSPANAALFPDAARARAAMLVRAARALQPEPCNPNNASRTMQPEQCNTKTNTDQLGKAPRPPVPLLAAPS